MELNFKCWNDIDKKFIDWATLKAQPVLFMDLIKGNVKHHTLLARARVNPVTGDWLYQGDIINDNVGIGYIVWCDENASFKIRYVGENAGIGKWFRDFLNSEYSNLEVIGHINKTPELLTNP